MYRELVGRIIMIIATMLSLRISWWAPVIVAPVIWFFYDLIFNMPGYQQKSLALDLLTHAIYISYFVLCIIQFGRNIERWYGWALGFFIALIIAQILGLLWPRRWHFEAIRKY